MKGKLWQSQHGEGEWHVTDRLSDAGSATQETNDEVAKSMTRSNSFSDDKIDNGKEIIDFLKDDPKDMTYSRRIALFLMEKKWYNPRAGETMEVEESDHPQASNLHSKGLKHEKSSDFDEASDRQGPAGRTHDHSPASRCHRYSVSPCTWAAQRDRTNSRSERRLT